MEEQFLGLLIYCIPALVTGAIAFLFFREHTRNENKRRNFILMKSLQKEVLPLRLQAYERLTLFLERITPHQLLKRVIPISNKPNSYKDLLISNIEQEYEHNISQQIYVSDPCWRMLSAAKNSSLQIIMNFNDDNADTAEAIRPLLLTALSECKVTTEIALKFLKEEASILLK